MNAVRLVRFKMPDMAGGATKYLHERPWQAIGIVAGFSLVIGALFGWSVSRR